MHKYFEAFNNAFLALFLDELIGDESYTLCFSNVSKSVFWNAANMINIPEGYANETIIDIELLFSQHRIPTTIWLTDYDSPQNVQTIFEDKGYMKKSTDSWMMLANPQSIKINNHGLTIKQVTDDELLKDFFTVYTPVWDNPRYVDAFKRKLFVSEYSEKSKIYVGYANNKPVAISGWVSHDNIAFTHSIATVESARKKGYGEQMFQHAVLESKASEVVFPVGSVYVNARRLAAKIGFKELMEVRVYNR